MSRKFGTKLKELRLKRNETLEELAEAIGSSKDYVWQLENKPISKPSAELVLKIAKHFKIFADYLIDDELEEYVDPRDNETFRMFQNLTREDKDYINKIMSGMGEQNDRGFKPF